MGTDRVRPPPPDGLMHMPEPRSVWHCGEHSHDTQVDAARCLLGREMVKTGGVQSFQEFSRYYAQRRRLAHLMEKSAASIASTAKQMSIAQDLGEHWPAMSPEEKLLPAGI